MSKEDKNIQERLVAGGSNIEKHSEILEKQGSGMQTKGNYEHLDFTNLEEAFMKGKYINYEVYKGKIKGVWYLTNFPFKFKFLHFLTDYHIY